jgi:signal transduction histidine kinase
VDLRVGFREGEDWRWFPGDESAPAPLPQEVEENQRFETRRITEVPRAEGPPGELELAVWIDGERLEERNEALLAGVFSVLGTTTLVGLLLTLLVHRRVRRLLAEVAEATRNAADAPEAVREVGGSAPREVAAIVEALGSLLTQLRSENEHRALMVAGLAHDLRSPIQVLLGEAEVTLLRDREPDEYRAALEGQVEELRELSSVLENLLMLVGHREHGRSTAFERFDLAGEVQLRLSRERAWAERAGVELLVHAEGDLEVVGDREALLLALRNLVRNALDHAPAGSRVLVHLQGSAEGWTLEVEDAGPGIPARDRERVLRPFEVGHSARRTRRTGGGLGLALVAQAATAHGGGVDIGESPLGGALVRVTIPRPASAA